MERAGEADREIAVECALGGTRAAVFEGGALVELHEERDGEQEQTEGLYLGCVQAVRPSVCAAFVDIGLARNAFLPLREGAVYRPGEMLIVQGAAGQSVTSKGMRVTDRPTLAGERLVLLPGEAGVRVSAKISDEALRARLIERAGAACPAGCGLIVRTAAADEAPLMEEAQALAAALALRDEAKGAVYEGALGRAAAYVREHRADRDLSLAGAAAQAGVTPGHLSALFRKRLGVTFTEYVTARRMELARTLLRDGGLTVEQAAWRSGFSDARYFSTLFKRTQGCTPTQFRAGKNL